MRLDNLFSKDKLILEDRVHPIDAHRLPPIQQYRKALPFIPALNLAERLEGLKKDALPEHNPDLLNLTPEEQLDSARNAFRTCVSDTQRHIISGLEQGTYWDAEKRTANDPNGYICLVADLDNTKWMNTESGLGHKGVNTVLRTIGELFENNFSYEEPDPVAGTTGKGIRNTRVYHPHGDEFRAFTNIKGLNRKYASKRLLSVIRAAVDLANQLSSYGFTHTDDALAEDSGTQATMTIGISNGVREADTLLAKAKNDCKFAIVVDSDLMNRLGFKEHCNRELRDLINRVNYPIQMEDQNKALDMLKARQGTILMECAYSGISPEDRMDFESMLRDRNAYFQSPRSCFPVIIGKRVYYLPLNELMG